MDFDKETSGKIEELQAMEGNLQAFLAQKQTVQLETNEINNALEELKKTDDEVYKVVSGIMIKSDKAKLSKDLEEKKKMLGMRMDALEKQEKILEKHAAGLKAEIDRVISGKK